MVGCDGANSRVRELAGLTIEDLSFDEQWLVVDLLLPEHPGAAGRNLPRHAVHVCDPARPHTAIPMPLGRYRFELQVLAGEDPAELQQPARVAQLLGPYLAPGEATVERAAVYTFHGLVARSGGPGGCSSPATPPTRCRPSSARACARACATRRTSPGSSARAAWPARARDLLDTYGPSAARTCARSPRP